MLSGNCSFSRITSITSLRMSRLPCGSNPGITPYRQHSVLPLGNTRQHASNRNEQSKCPLDLDESRGLRQIAGFVPNSGLTGNETEIKYNKNSILCLLTHSTSGF